MRGEGFIGQFIKLARSSIPFNGGIELLRIESLEPRAESREFARGELFDGSLVIPDL